MGSSNGRVAIIHSIYCLERDVDLKERWISMRRRVSRLCLFALTEGDVSVAPWNTARLAAAVGDGVVCVAFGAAVVASGRATAPVLTGK